MPAETVANMLAWAEPTSRTVEVEQFCSWSACRMKQQVERLDERRVDLVGLGREPERHPQEVLGERQRVVGVEERLPDGLLVRVCGDGRQLRQQPDRGELDLLLVEGVEAVLVEGRQRRDRRRQHRHRVRVAGEAGEERLEVLVQHRVAADPVLELGQLVLRRQLAVDQQVGHLDEGGLLGQLLDGVPAVAQDAGVTVDVGDRALARGGVDEAGVVGDGAGVLEQRRDRQRVGSRRWRGRRAGSGSCRRR